MRGRCVGVRSVPSTRSSSVNATVGIRASITLLQTQSSHQQPSTLTALPFRAPARRPLCTSASPFILPPLHVPPLPARPPPSANWGPPPGGMPAASRAVLWSRYGAAAQLAQTPFVDGRSRPSNIYPVSLWSALLRSRPLSASVVIVFRKGPSACSGAAQYATPRALEVGVVLGYLTSPAYTEVRVAGWTSARPLPPPLGAHLQPCSPLVPPPSHLTPSPAILPFPFPPIPPYHPTPCTSTSARPPSPFRTPVPAAHREGYLLPKRIASGRPDSIGSRP